MITFIFGLCVLALQWIAQLLGTSYEAVNVVIFCFLWPVATLLLLADCLRARKKLRCNRNVTATARKRHSFEEESKNEKQPGGPAELNLLKMQERQIH